VQEECGHFALFTSLDKGKIDAKTRKNFSSDSKSASKFMLQKGPNSTKCANLVERACGKTLLEPRFPMIGVLPKRTSINWFGGLKKIIGS
jgi:hypothetical protein